MNINIYYNINNNGLDLYSTFLVTKTTTIQKPSKSMLVPVLETGSKQQSPFLVLKDQFLLLVNEKCSAVF